MKRFLSLILAFVFVIGICASAPVTITANATDLKDVISAEGDYTLNLGEYSFTPSVTGYYVFESFGDYDPCIEIDVNDCFYENDDYNELNFKLCVYIEANCEATIFLDDYADNTSVTFTITYAGTEKPDWVQDDELDDPNDDSDDETPGDSNDDSNNETTDVSNALVFELNDSDDSYSVSASSRIISGEIVIPSTYNGLPVTSIGDDAFYNCDSITSVTIPDSVTSIGEEAFYNCTSLANVTIPDGVTYIYDGAFYNTGYYNNSSNWGNDVLYIGNHLIKAKTSLFDAYVIKEGTKCIADSAFYDCSSLTSITIPDSVTSIGDEAFKNCYKLNAVYISDIASWCYMDFYYANNPLYYGGNLYLNGKLVTNLVIPEGVKSINDYVFYNCTSITSVTIPDSVTSIGDLAFYNCVYLTSVAIGNSVTSIGDYAFKYCTALTSVTIPDSVTSIGNSAFYDCSSLTSVAIGNSVTSIGNFAFYDCSSLTSVAIGNSVTSIGNSAFYNCVYLTSVTIGNSVTSIGDSAFYHCNSLTSVTIPDSVTSIGYSAFYNCASLTSITIPDSITCIAGFAFAKCYSLESIVIPDSVTSIGEYAFCDCDSLTSVTIPDSVTSIGNSAFESCDSLTSVTIGNSVTKINVYAFAYCKSLESISVPNSVTRIGDDAFYSCYALEDVYYNGSYDDFASISIGEGNMRFADFPKIHYFGSSADTTNLQKIETVFTILDSKGGEVSSSKAIYNDDATVLTSNSLSLNLSSVSEKLVFSKDGYKNYIIPKTVLSEFYNKGISSHSVYMDSAVIDDKPYISTVFAKCTTESESFKEVTTQEILLIKNQTYDVIVSSENSDKTVSDYYISQDEWHKVKSSNGVFSSQDLYSVFNEGKPIYVYATYTDGKRTNPVEIKLTKTEMPDWLSELYYNDPTINLLGSEGLEMKIPEDAPVLGGVGISSGLCEFPVGIELEGNRLKFSFGIDLFEYENSIGDKKPGEWENFKADCKSVNNALEDSVEKVEKLKTFANEYSDGKYKPGSADKKANFDLSVFGYAEAYLYNGGIVFTEIGGTLAGEIFVSVTKQLLAYGVPVYVSAKLGAELSVKPEWVREIPDKDLAMLFDATLELEPQLKVSAGIGVKDLVSGGVWGEGSAQTTFSLPNDKLFTFGLKGEIGIEAELLFINWSETLLEGEITLVSHNFKGVCKNSNCFCKEKSTKTLSNSISDFMLTPESYNSSSNGVTYKVASREYSESTSKWLGNMGFPKQYLSSLFGVSKESTTVKELQTSVYKNSQLQLVEFNDTLMMAWIEDCEERDDYNRFRLVYSVYNKTLDTWSKPKAVADSVTNDYLPSLASDGENVYIAWQNINHTFTTVDENTIQTILTNSEIKVAKYNSETDTFENVKTLTDNASYDYAPIVTVNNGVAEIYWVNASTTDYSAGSFSILKNNFTDTTNTVVAENLNYITEIDASGSEVSYCMDVDGDLSTNDIETFTNTTQVSIRDEVMPSSCVQVAYGTFKGNNTLFYADSYNIHYVENNEIKDVFKTSRAINGNLIVTANGDVTTLLWSEQSKVGTEIFTCSYEEGAWSEPIQLTEYNAKISNIDAVYFNNLLYGVFNRTNLEETVTDGESTYTDESTDICVLQTDKFTDLEISEIIVNESTFVPGGNARISVFVENKGTELINNVEFVVSDSSGNKTTITKDINLASGELELIDVEYTVPENFSATTLAVTANVTNDIDSKNNSSEIAVGNTDISINDIKYEKLEDYYVVTAILKNNNLIKAEDVVFNAYLDDTDQSYGNVEIGTVNAGELKELRFKFNKNAFDFTDGYEQVKFTVTTTTNEQLTENNSAIVVISKPEHLETEWVVVKEATCTTDGLKEKQCTECKAVLETETIPAIGHTTSVVNKKDATCTAAGYTGDTYCSVCKTTTTNGSVIKAKGHTEITIVGKAATCTQAGLTDGKKCSVCGTVTVAQKEIASKGHTTSVINKKSATCTVGGYTGDTYCSTCKTTTVKGSVIKAKGHTETTIAGKAATCITTGLTDGKKCSVCGTVTKAQETIKAKGHTTSVINKKDATCTVDGYTGDTYCSVCKTTTVKGKAIAKLGHSYNAGEITTKVTCEKDGVKTFTCTRCKATKTDTIKATGHKEVVIPAVSPTYTTVGKTEGKKCSVCGTVTVAQKDVAKLTLATPVVTVKNSATGVKVTWNAVDGATSYKVYRKTYSTKNKKYGSWKTCGTAKTTSYVDATAKSGTKYIYTVKALNGDIKSGIKSSSSILFLSQPTVKIANNASGVKVSWNKITGATGYKVYRSEYTNGKWSGWKSVKTIDKGSTVSWTDKSAKSGVKYKYTVKAVNGKTASTYKSSSSLLYLVQPKTTVKAVSNGVKVNWTQITGATNYKIYRSEYNTKTKKWSSWKSIKTAKSTSKSYTDKSAKKGVKYRYTVKAVNGKVASTYKASSSVKR